MSSSQATLEFASGLTLKYHSPWMITLHDKAKQVMYISSDCGCGFRDMPAFFFLGLYFYNKAQVNGESIRMQPVLKRQMEQYADMSFVISEMEDHDMRTDEVFWNAPHDTPPVNHVKVQFLVEWTEKGEKKQERMNSTFMSISKAQFEY